MITRESLGVLIASLMLGFAPPGQAPDGVPGAPVAPGAPMPPPNAQMHWTQRIGWRIEQVNRSLPIIDRVVLVPDAATYLDEVSKWSSQSRWPVLFEDRLYAPMFIRRFAPQQVIRRESVGVALPEDMEQRRSLMRGAVIRAWGGNPEVHTTRQVFDAAQYVPPGIVVTASSDPAWTAAVALAAGHGEPLAFLDDPFHSADNAPLKADVEKFATSLARVITEQGYSFLGQGDDIDTITICRQMGGRMRHQELGRELDYFAMTDVLGRGNDGSRWAFVGWIFGPESRCAYVAMCSLFLPREQVWMFNAYSTTQQPWSVYSFAESQTLLKSLGYDVEHHAEPQASSRDWLNLLPGGVTTDLLFVNTKGNTDFFEMLDKGDWCYPDDVPVLNMPAAVHFAHSWSFQRPDGADTVGGQWLRQGAYAYVGSVHEPGLGAFIPPGDVIKRVIAGIPFLIASRVWDGPVWKINTYGDPLMLAHSPKEAPRIRRAEAANYGVDLLQEVKTLIAAASQDPAAAVFAKAIDLLNLLGKDEIAVQLWRHAEQKGAAAAAAAPALGPLFRTRQLDQFQAAWMNLDSRDEQAADMLWHLMGPRLGAIRDKDMMLQMQAAIRRPNAHADLSRLYPHLVAVFGQAHARDVVQRELERASSQRAKQKLQELLK